MKRINVSKLTPVTNWKDIRDGVEYVIWCSVCEEHHRTRVLERQAHVKCLPRTCMWIAFATECAPEGATCGIGKCHFTKANRLGLKRIFFADSTGERTSRELERTR
jgi:hypothetical protein